VARLAFSLRETAEELEEPYREALILTEYEGLTQAEYAARAGLSLSGAKSRVQRAREKLKQLLLDCCHFELDRRGGIIDFYPRCCRCDSGRIPASS
jgi:RNA polymerase sigma-70 factor (ECF subfamily)